MMHEIDQFITIYLAFYPKRIQNMSAKCVSCVNIGLLGTLSDTLLSVGDSMLKVSCVELCVDVSCLNKFSCYLHCVFPPTLWWSCKDKSADTGCERAFAKYCCTNKSDEHLIIMISW